MHTKLIIFLLLLSLTLSAQTQGLWPEYDRCYDKTTEVGGGRMCKPLPNGTGYVVVGDSRLGVTDGKQHHGTFNVSWNEDAYIAITDNNFNVIKSNIFGGTLANDDNDYFTDVFPQADGGFVCFGRANSYDGDIPAPSFSSGYGMLLLKVDSNLNLVWSKPYNVTGIVEMSCVQSSDGGFILLGASGVASGDANIDLDGTPLLYDWTVVKTDVNGNKLWAKVYGSTDGELPDGGVVEDKAGNIYIIGSSDGRDLDCQAADTTWRMGLATNSDIYVVKIDAGGNRLWSRSYGGTQEDVLITALYDSINNEIIVGGGTDSKDLHFSAAQYLSDDAFFMRLDTAGSLQQVKVIGGNHLDFVKNISLGPDPNTYFVGIHTQSNNDGDFVGYTHPTTGGGGLDIFLGLIDQQGNFDMKYGEYNLNWENALQYSYFDNIRGEVILHGLFGADVYLHCDTDTTSVTTAGNFYKPSVRRFRFTPVSTKNIDNKELGFTLYPNPVHDRFYVQLKTTAEYTIVVYDLSGKQLITKSKAEANEGIDISMLATGSYSIQLKTKDYTLHKKLILSP